MRILFLKWDGYDGRVIDSGITRRAVVDALMKRLPGHDIVYFRNRACLRRPEFQTDHHLVRRRENSEPLKPPLLMPGQPRHISLALEDLSRQRDLPIFDAVTPAADEALEASRRRRIGVVASRAVVDSTRYLAVIRERCPQAEVIAAACPLWSALVEEGWGKRRETAMVIKHDLRPIKLQQVDTLILGSSYFTPLRRVVQRKMGMQVSLVEPAAALATRVAAHLKRPAAGGERIAGRPRVRLLVSDLTPQAVRAARWIVGRPVVLETPEGCG
jgi:glutamate racemase